ncbi:MAG: Ig-like domain-containing protein [Ruthenibacterium sp.]
MKKLIALVIALAMSLSLTACGATLTKIEAPPEIVLEKGETKLVELVSTFSNENLDEAAMQKALDAANLTWTSSDESIVTVTDGTVNALAAGEADVTVTGKDISATIHVTVVVLPTDIEAPDELELVINGEDSKNLDAKITPEDATGVMLQYESSDESVATVDETGQVTAVGTGECVITTSVVSSETKAPAPQEPVAEADESTPAEPTSGTEGTTSAPQEPNVEADDDIDPDMLVVTLKAETKVTVSVAATGIALDSTSGWIYVGGSVQLKPYTVPAEAAASTYTFKSDNEKVATVSASGAITGKAAGTTKITITSAEGFTATYSITVKTKATTTTKPTTGGSTGTTGGGSTGGGSTGGGSTGGGTTPTPQPPAPQPPAPTPEPPAPPAPPTDGGGHEVTPGGGRDEGDGGF